MTTESDFFEPVDTSMECACCEGMPTTFVCEDCKAEWAAAEDEMFDELDKWARHPSDEEFNYELQMFRGVVVCDHCDEVRAAHLAFVDRNGAMTCLECGTRDSEFDCNGRDCDGVSAEHPGGWDLN